MRLIFLCFLLVMHLGYVHTPTHTGPENIHRREPLNENSCDISSLAKRTSSWRLALCLGLDDALKYEPQCAWSRL